MQENYAQGKFAEKTSILEEIFASFFTFFFFIFDFGADSDGDA